MTALLALTLALALLLLRRPRQRAGASPSPPDSGIPVAEDPARQPGEEPMTATQFSLGGSAAPRRPVHLSPERSRSGPCDARIARALASRIPQPWPHRLHPHARSRLCRWRPPAPAPPKRPARSVSSRSRRGVAMDRRHPPRTPAGRTRRPSFHQPGLRDRRADRRTRIIADGAADLIFLSEPMPYPCSPLGAALARLGGRVLVGTRRARPPAGDARPASPRTTGRTSDSPRPATRADR